MICHECKKHIFGKSYDVGQVFYCNRACFIKLRNRTHKGLEKPLER